MPLWRRVAAIGCIGSLCGRLRARRRYKAGRRDSVPGQRITGNLVPSVEATQRFDSTG